MGCGEDYTAQILLDIENCDGRNHPEVEGRPGRSAVGRPENTNVGCGKHSVRRGVIAIDQQSQHRNVGQRVYGRRNLEGRIAVGLRPCTAEVRGHENVTHTGSSRETGKAQVGGAVIERVNGNSGRLRGIREHDWRQLRGLVGPLGAIGPAGADLEVGLVGGEDFERRRTKGRAGLNRERVRLGIIRRRDLEILERARATVASAGQILSRLRRPCRHPVIRHVNRMRAKQYAPGDGRIARERRIVGCAVVARRRHRSLQCRARSGGIESDSAVGRARNPCSDRGGRERMIGKQRIHRVEERESAVEIIHL